MTEQDDVALAAYQASDEGMTEHCIHSLGLIVADLESSANRRDGLAILRSQAADLYEARDRLTDLIQRIAPHQIAAE